MRDEGIEPAGDIRTPAHAGLFKCPRGDLGKRRAMTRRDHTDADRITL